MSRPSRKCAKEKLDRGVAVCQADSVEETPTEADVVRGLSTLAALPDAMRLAFRTAGGKGDPASVGVVKPWAIRAASALGEPVSDTARGVLDGAMPVLHARYKHLMAAYRRTGGGELPVLPAVVVGVAGAVTAAVAAALRAAWPVVVRAAVAVGRLLGKHPVKVAVATTTAGALPGLYRAGKDLGRAAAGVTASLVPEGGGVGAGLPLLLLLGLGYLLLRK